MFNSCMFIFVSCENFKLTKKFSNLYNMLEEELDDLTRKRSELDDIIADLYELKPLLEKCESDTILKNIMNVMYLFCLLQSRTYVTNHFLSISYLGSRCITNKN